MKMSEDVLFNQHFMNDQLSLTLRTARIEILLPTTTERRQGYNRFRKAEGTHRLPGLTVSS
jgi:hypothetical protein